MVNDILAAVGAGLDVGCWSGALDRSFSSADPEELIRTYQSATQQLAADPNNVQAHFTRGVVCQLKRWFPQALADFMEVVRLEPRHARAWLLMSEVLTNLGEYERAKLARQEARALDPGCG